MYASTPAIMTPAGAAIVLAGLLQITGQAVALNNGELYLLLFWFCFAGASSISSEADSQMPHQSSPSGCHTDRPCRVLRTRVTVPLQAWGRFRRWAGTAGART